MNPGGAEPARPPAGQSTALRPLSLEERVARLEAIAARLETAAARDARAGFPDAGHGRPAAEPDAATLEEAWGSSPLAARLAFVRAMLPQDHPYQPALLEAAALVELWRKGPELETWLTGYPSLFADAFARLELAPQLSDAPGRLAHRTVGEALGLLETHLRGIGIEILRPRPGSVPGDACEVIGEAPAAGVPPGRVASCRRIGLRQRGRLLLPPQVLRAAGGGGREPDAARAPDAAGAALLSLPTAPVAAAPQPAAAPAPPPARRPGPAWLAGLQRDAAGEPATEAAVRGLAALAARVSESRGIPDDDELVRLLRPLLAHLAACRGGPVDGARSQIRTWLRERLDVEILLPGEGDPFDPTAMRAVDARRTAHLHEQGTVAKVEMPGLRRSGRVLLPAEVVSYEMGAGD